MRYVTLLALASFFGVGCYTQVKSTGDYWGYSGHRHHRAVLVESDTTYARAQSQQPTDSSAAQLEYPPDDGTTVINNYYEDIPWSHPYYYYWGDPGPAVGFSITIGNPWFYGPVYRPYAWGWDPWYYDSYYYGGWGSYYGGWYGCVVPPIYPYYGFYRSYYRDHYHYDRGSSGSHGGYSGGRGGRISGGEQRIGSSTSGVAPNNGSIQGGGRPASPRPTGRPPYRASTPRMNAQNQPYTGGRPRNTNMQSSRDYVPMPLGARPPSGAIQSSRPNGNYSRPNVYGGTRPARSGSRPVYNSGEGRASVPAHTGSSSGGSRQGGGGSGSSSNGGAHSGGRPGK